jgi:hypothetical protein
MKFNAWLRYSSAWTFADLWLLFVDEAAGIAVAATASLPAWSAVSSQTYAGRVWEWQNKTSDLNWDTLKMYCF